MKHFTVLLKAQITYTWAQETNSLNEIKSELESFHEFRVKRLGILLLENQRQKKH